jgi:hypothetical protein
LPIVLLLGFSLGVLLIQETYQLACVSEQTGDRLVYVCSEISTISALVFLFLMVTIGIEIRERGYVTFFLFVRWDEVESYGFRYVRNDVLFLRLKRRDNPVLLEKLVNPAKKEMADRILRPYFPHGEQGIMTGLDPLQIVDWSAPAQQVRDPASLLLVYAVMQIAGSLIYTALLVLSLMLNPNFETAWGMSKNTALIGIFLAAVGAAPGVIIAVGVRRIRKLENQRFCRMACILAMLPTGLGFVFGLPAGIWALRVLNRPEVKAAFASSKQADST